MEEICKNLDEKFMAFHSTIHNTKSWVIHDWSYYGASYGMVLTCRQGKTAKDVWKIDQMLESGYMGGKTLLETTEYYDIFPWTEVLAPTNPYYKTDRK